MIISGALCTWCGDWSTRAQCDPVVQFRKERASTHCQQFWAGWQWNRNIRESQTHISGARNEVDCILTFWPMAAARTRTHIIARSNCAIVKKKPRLMQVEVCKPYRQPPMSTWCETTKCSNSFTFTQFVTMHNALLLETCVAMKPVNLSAQAHCPAHLLAAAMFAIQISLVLYMYSISNAKARISFMNDRTKWIEYGKKPTCQIERF